MLALVLRKTVFCRPVRRVFLHISRALVALIINPGETAGFIRDDPRAVIPQLAVFLNRSLPDRDPLRKRKIIIRQLQHILAAGLRFNDDGSSEIFIAMAGVKQANLFRYFIGKQCKYLYDLIIHTLFLLCFTAF